MVTAEYVRDLLRYDPETGLFTWNKDRVTRKPGDSAGSVTKLGYLDIIVCRRLYKAHRLAWLHVYGEWPKQEIDHINGDKLDNRIANLRDVSRSMNVQNLQKARRDNKSSGLLGVSSSYGRWVARIWNDGRLRHIGYYDTPELAHAAYVATKRELHEGCTI
jgi:hypothetical protein